MAGFIASHHNFFNNWLMWSLSISFQPKCYALHIVQPSKLGGDSGSSDTLREFQVDRKSIRALFNKYLTWNLVHSRCQNTFVEWICCWVIHTVVKQTQPFRVNYPIKTARLQEALVSLSSVRYQIIAWNRESLLMMLPAW